MRILHFLICWFSTPPEKTEAKIVKYLAKFSDTFHCCSNINILSELFQIY